MTISLPYYASHGPMTDPQEHARALTDLPTDVLELCRVVQGVLIHTYWVEQHRIRLSGMRKQDVHLRPAAQILARLHELDARPLSESRPPEWRMVGNCRTFSVLLCTMLRQQGVPARARCGFAAYLGSPIYCDHWVCEYWNQAERRWVLVDAELDELHHSAYPFDFEPWDVPRDQFIVAGDAWQQSRDKRTDSRRFGFDGRHRGLAYVRGNLLRDLLSLNKVELLPWDTWWGAPFTDKIASLAAAELAQLDQIAALTLGSDDTFSELRAAYTGDTRLYAPVEARLKSESRVPREDPAAQGPPIRLPAAPPQPQPPTSAAETRSPRFRRRQPISASEQGKLVVRDAHQHNLRHIDVTIPRDKLVVLTGVSGSGKSSLALDTIYAEGQRRYVESLSAYARQYIEQMEKPKVEHIAGLSPAIAIEQRAVSNNPRSTVGTLTEIINYIRLLFSRIGLPHCTQCGLAGEEYMLFSERHACPRCGTQRPFLTVAHFNPNSPFGMCPDCNGLGVELEVDPALIVENPALSLYDGASRWYGNLRKKKGAKNWLGNLETVAEHYGVDLQTPWQDLPQRFRDVVLYGSGDEKIRFTEQSEWNEGSLSTESVRPIKGLIYHINRLFRQTKSEMTRRWYASFMSQQPCPACAGTRLCAEARAVTFGGKTIAEVSALAIDELVAWVERLFETLSSEQLSIGGEALQEIGERLQFMLDVGLHYLTLDRSAPTLSGGEGQRIRLASQLGCGLVGVLYILDEPSIGLHARDQRALLDTLVHLRDLGNTVLVVEHDAATMLRADWLIDMGLGAGVLGGEVVAEGPPEIVARNPRSLTGRYLSGELSVTAPNARRHAPAQSWLTLVGARLHNLRRVTARFPLGLLTCITGVSGSGKSSLIARTLHPALQRILHHAQSTPGPFDRLEGVEYLDKVITITQEPIGRTPRSNPATYTGVFDEIRRVFAGTTEAQAQDFKAEHFSFNVAGGRCEECQGHGQRKIEMHFLADVWVMCKACDGTRFKEETRAIRYRGKNIADVLDMDVQEAIAFFVDHPKITRILQTLKDVGLGYVKLGQSATTFSGGEAQRIKLASELSRVAAGHTLYILDEPTIGLHFADIQRLLDVLHRLVDAGNTVIVIEHNLDVIKTADWLIDMGPEGGVGGGTIVAEGPPDAVAQVTTSYTGRALREVLSP